MKKVLYLDDSTMSQQLMARFLEGLCEVVPCTSLEEGRRVLAASAVDMIITDFLFPEGDPLEFLSELRRTHSPEALPVLVASGSLDRRMESQVLRLGANDCLRKPLRRQEVRDLVGAMLRRPTVRKLEGGLTVITVFSWSRKGRYYQYAPDISLEIEAGSPGEAADKMMGALAEAMRSPEKAEEFGYALHGEASTVEIAPAAKA